MQVEVFEELFLYTSAHSIAEQRAVWNNDRGEGRLAGVGWLPMELAHNELDEQQRGFGCLPILREISLDTLFLFSAEWRVGQDNIDAIALANFREPEAQRVPRI